MVIKRNHITQIKFILLKIIRDNRLFVIGMKDRAMRDCYGDLCNEKTKALVPLTCQNVGDIIENNDIESLLEQLYLSSRESVMQVLESEYLDYCRQCCQDPDYFVDFLNENGIVVRRWIKDGVC